MSRRHNPPIARTRLLTTLQQDTRLIRAAINDLAKENVTAGEIPAEVQDGAA
jgi:hypothetical protein